MDPRKPPLLAALSPPSRLLFSLLLMVACFALTFLVGVLAAMPLFGYGPAEITSALSEPAGQETLKLLEYFQVVQSFGLFILPPLIAGWLFERSGFRFLALDRPSRGYFYLATLLLMFVSLPFINWLIVLNEGFRLPEAFRAVEEWMRSSEEAAARLTDTFMEMPTPGAFLFNLFMIALLPALGEEFVFRGLLQRLFREWLGNAHLAILLAALLFSAMHLQFYGFLPRLVLGLLFGYLLYFSGSLWVPVFAHMLNNGAAVTAEYLAQRGVLTGNYEQFGATENGLIIAASGLFTLLILFFIRRKQTG